MGGVGLSGSWVSLVPPLVAIVLAVVTRRVVVPLAAGVLVGAGLAAVGGSGNWVAAATGIVGGAVWDSVAGRDHLLALAFSLLLGGMVGVLERGGSMVALIDRVTRGWGARLGAAGEALSRRDGRNRAQRLIAAVGLVIFFDDYANTLLVGGTMRGTADRAGLSREKLAYLVDSTSAPIAGLSIISTWAAIEMSYMADGLRSAGIPSDSAAFELFLRSIPYRFYPILALWMVAVVVVTGRDFGPMRRCEEAAREAFEPPEPVERQSAVHPHFHWAAIAPVGMCLLSVLATLLWTGWGAAGGDAKTSSWLLATMRVFGDGDPYLALVIGGAVGLGLAGWLDHRLGGADWPAVGSRALAGGRQMMPAMVILWLAWAMTDMTDRLQTGEYLASVLSGGLPPVTLPAAVFLIAGGVAFSTGTSWGTMGLLTPLSVKLSIDLSLADVTDVDAVLNDPIVLATTGAVLAGAIFGDHCSPISDTTVLSSRSSGCDHLSHVRTQLPYAVLVAAVSVVVGALPVWAGVSPVWGGLLGAAGILGWVWGVGRG